MDEVAPHFAHRHIVDYCKLIDQKAAKGLKYDDLKEKLLSLISSSVPLDNENDSFNIYRKAYEFVKWY